MSLRVDEWRAFKRLSAFGRAPVFKTSLRAETFALIPSTGSPPTLLPSTHRFGAVFVLGLGGGRKAISCVLLQPLVASTHL